MSCSTNVPIPPLPPGWPVPQPPRPPKPIPLPPGWPWPIPPRPTPTPRPPQPDSPAQCFVCYAKECDAAGGKGFANMYSTESKGWPEYLQWLAIAAVVTIVFVALYKKYRKM